MAKVDGLPVNFTISEAAKSAIEDLRRDWDRRSPDDPAAVPMIGWGIFKNRREEAKLENVVVSFYNRSQLPRVKPGIEQVSGIDVLFFVTRPYHENFAGKVLDFAEERWFFLRGQDSADA